MVLLTTFADGNFFKRSLNRRILFFVHPNVSNVPAKSKFISSFANDNVGSFVVFSVPSKTLRF